MLDKQTIEVSGDKVPDLKSPGKVFLTVLYVLCLGALCAVFFFYVDRIAWYAPVLSQFAVALIVTAISYIHFKVV